MSADTPLLLQRRTRAEILEHLLQDLPGYMQNWHLKDLSSSRMVTQVFARYLEILADGVNQVPDRSLMAFLAMLGTELLPAQAAEVPLVFTLMENAPVNVTLPVGSQVAAPARPEPPSPLQPNRSPAEPKDAIFSTLQTVTLTRAKLAALYSIDPGSDEFAEHTIHLAKGFTLFDQMQLTEHSIYLGHDEMFAIGGEDIVVMLSFSLERFASRELKTQWEYLTESGWSPFESTVQDDSTSGMRHDGLIMLRRDCAPKAKQETIEGRTSYWLRGTLTSPLLPDGGNGERTVPIVNDIRARVGFKRTDIAPEAAYTDAATLDISKDFFPFGQQPVTFTTFYLACKEVFQRKGAIVKMDVALRQNGLVDSGKTRQVEWEYYDGETWEGLSVSPSNYDFAAPNTSSGSVKVTISFNCPPDWAETSVNGESNYWLRVRITKGDYGHSLVATIDGTDDTKIHLTPANLKPPIISSITFAFTYLTDPFELDHCLSRNDFIFEDHTQDCRWPHRTFTPFQTVADNRPAVHFGFDKQLPTGLISLYANILNESTETSQSSPFLWEYHSERGWIELGVLDQTLGFQRSGMIQFIGQPDAVSALGLGGDLYRVRARLKQGESIRALPVQGMWLNAISASQRSASQREEVGISDGNPGQTFFLRRTPVLAGEMIEVQEWVGRGESWRTTLDDLSEENRRLVRDPVSNQVTSVWVTWHSQPHLYSSGRNDRHYTIERGMGLIRFGDNQNGRMPPAGSRIAVTYSSGGGMAGNVQASTVTELRSAMTYVQSVTNPIPASGGAEIETDWAVKRRGPQRLRNHDRGVSAEDIEWIAREASPDVARVRCLPITSASGHAQRGFVTLLAVPISTDSQPEPSPEFRRRVREYLAKRVPFSLAHHIRIIPAQYTLVGVHAEIIPHLAGQAAQVEALLRQNLNRFLHPLNGGPDGQGWAFGQAVYLSQIARVIEETPGVDYASEIQLHAGGQIFKDIVPIDVNGLVAAGDHELRIVIGAD